MTYVLPKSMRKELKKPWGVLLSSAALDRHMKLHRYKKVVAVGDEVANLLCDMGMQPDVSIIDGYVMRKKVRIRLAPTLAAENPAGAITDGLVAAVKTALRSKKREVVMVEGEEDLAAIPAIIHSPAGTAVLYGLPGNGTVLIEVGDDVRKNVAALLGRMKRV